MPESVYHNASMAAFAVPESKKIEPNEEPRIEQDPLVAFEYFHFQIKTDLSNWMTFSQDDRMKKAALIGSLDLEDGSKVMSSAGRWSPAKRHKVLNYIIWIESISKKGSREVAAVAFKSLFPQAKKAE